MPATIDQINRYEVGNHPYLAELATFIGGQAVKDEMRLEPVTIEPADYEQALEEINETWGEIEDPISGKTYETAVVNLSASLDEGFDIEVATEKSSLSNNPGNVVEFAANSAVHPGRKRLYIASPGNGLAGDFDRDEHEYIRRTGRLTYEGYPLPTFARLARAINEAGLSTGSGVRIAGNSAGGSYARGLMAALDYNTVTHAYLKNIPGVINHRPGVLWSTAALLGDMLDDRRSSKKSQDPWKLTPAMVEHAKALTPNIYGPEKSQNRQQTKAQQARTSHSPSKLVTTAMMLASGSETKGDPAAVDTAEALRQQPGALITNHFSLHDRLYGGREDMYRYLQQAYNLGTIATGEQVKILLMIMSGTHRDHTAYPGLRWSAESKAFTRQDGRPGISE